jgi:hypothetical protein
MSLVAYGASDDSETSDVDDTEVSRLAGKGDGQISDEDDYVPTSQQSATSTTNSSSPYSSVRAAPASASLSGEARMQFKLSVASIKCALVRPLQSIQYYAAV